MDKMELKALGKINLGLDVLGRRENGYHDVRMVMQTVYLYDQIVITKTKQPGVKAETNLFYLPVDENNLACRAAKMLIDEFNITEGVHISMDKKIPVSAGMAGGSADAAAVVGGFPVILERFACIRFQYRDDFPDVLTVVVLLDGPVRPESQDDTGHYGDKVREKRSPRFGFKQIHRLGSFHVPAVLGPDAGLSNDF